MSVVVSLTLTRHVCQFAVQLSTNDTGLTVVSTLNTMLHEVDVQPVAADKTSRDSCRQLLPPQDVTLHRKVSLTLSRSIISDDRIRFAKRKKKQRLITGVGHSGDVTRTVGRGRGTWL